jgi:UDP-4-amino-4,6-dideoxy-N-acetyl-beta-L-altrosamine transaminase
MISYGKQSVDQSDIDAVVEVLGGDWLTQGPYVGAFEKDLSSYFGSEHCAVVSNGTAALHLVGIAMGWGPGDTVLTTPNTFLATANSAVYSGAEPNFVDIDPISYNIDPNKLEQKIQFLHKQGKRVKAVVAVDYAGNPCDWAAIREIADRYKLQVINDNCHAMGAEYHGERKYAVRYADVVIQSYHPVKHITSGEGGAVFTNNQKIDKKIRLLRSHGMSKREAQLEKNDGPWYYEMHELGFNYRITDIQCALGNNQLKKLEKFNQARTCIAEKYDIAFEDNNLITSPMISDDVKHAYHIYPVLIDFQQAGISKTDFFHRMKVADILLQVHYIPIHLQPFYRKQYGFKRGDYPIAENFYSMEVSLPVYPDLTEADQNHVIDSIIRILRING